MARIVLGSYMVRYPMGGMMSWVLQYLVGLHRLGHDVYFVEKSTYPDDCYDPVRNVMTSNCEHGLSTLRSLLDRFDLESKWCFVDITGRYFGLDRPRIEEVFRTADLFIDMGAHGGWDEEAAAAARRILVDGDPGFTQLRMQQEVDAGKPQTQYDFFFTTGRNVGERAHSIPTAQKEWHHLFHPVVVDLYEAATCLPGASYTTVMNWKSYEPVRYNGVFYGQKDLEFEKFLELPKLSPAPLEVAVAGKDVPLDRLKEAGWGISDAHDVTISYDSFVRYVQQSRGEFSVCKHGYVVSHSGWFSDRSAVYLACGKPVIMQDTGFSRHLPCGSGLLSFETIEGAREAIEAVESAYDAHAKTAREIAREHLDAPKVLATVLSEIGI